MLLRIFIILIVLGICCSIGEYLWHHKVILSIAVISILTFLAKGRESAFNFLLFATVIYLGFKALLYLYKNYNETRLGTYLKKNCSNYGYMDDEKWRSLLPKFYNLPYQTSFEAITYKFACQEERVAFSESSMRNQYSVCYQVLKEQSGAILFNEFVQKLIQKNTNYLQHTHSSSNEDLMEKLIEQYSQENTNVESVDTKEGKLIKHDDLIGKEIYSFDEI